MIRVSGWKKVYLYYGAVFFGLGLAGFLLSSRSVPLDWVRGAIDDFTYDLIDAGLIRPHESREVSVLESRFPAVIFLNSIKDQGRDLDKLNREILIKMRDSFPQIIKYAVTDETWSQMKPIHALLQNYPLIIGLNDYSNLVFSMPESLASVFFQRLVNHRPEFPAFRLELLYRDRVMLYRLSWLKTIHNEGYVLMLTDMLIGIWKTADINSV